MSVVSVGSGRPLQAGESRARSTFERHAYCSFHIPARVAMVKLPCRDAASCRRQRWPRAVGYKRACNEFPILKPCRSGLSWLLKQSCPVLLYICPDTITRNDLHPNQPRPAPPVPDYPRCREHRRPLTTLAVPAHMVPQNSNTNTASSLPRVQTACSGVPHEMLFTGAQA